jgi:hypothetical protein
MISPSLLQFIFGLRSLLAEVMVEEHSPLLDVAGDVPEVRKSTLHSLLAEVIYPSGVVSEQLFFR